MYILNNKFKMSKKIIKIKNNNETNKLFNYL